jgi:hypothetical protein
VRARLADRVGDALGGIAVILNQPLIAGGLLERMQILALRILDGLDLERVLVAERAHDDRHGRELGDLGRSPAPLAGDDLERVAFLRRMRPREDRLEDAFLGDRFRELGQALLVKALARIGLARKERGDRDGGLEMLGRNGRRQCGGHSFFSSGIAGWI